MAIIKKLNNYTTVKFNGFDEGAIEFNLHEDERDVSDQYKDFYVEFKLKENVKVSEAISYKITNTYTNKFDRNYDSDYKPYVTTEKGEISFNIFDPKLFRDEFVNIRGKAGGDKFRHDYGYDDEDETYEVEIELTIETFEIIQNDALDDIANHYTIELNDTKTTITDDNGIEKKYYVDYVHLWLKDLTQERDLLIYDDYCNGKSVYYFDVNASSSSIDYKTISITTSNHEINIIDVFDSRDYVGVLFKFDGNCHYSIDNSSKQLKAIGISDNRLRNAEMTHVMSQFPSKLNGVINLPCSVYSTVGRTMITDYYSSYTNRAVNSDMSYSDFEFNVDFNNIDSTKNQFVIYCEPDITTYESIYSYVKNTRIDIETSNGDAIKFVGFIGMSDMNVIDEHFNSSVNTSFINDCISIAYGNYNDDDEKEIMKQETASKLKAKNLVFMPCGEMIDLMDEDCDTNLGAQVNMYTTFYPVFLKRQRRVKLLNVGNNALDKDFKIITDAVRSQVNKTNADNNEHIESSEIEVKSYEQFLSAIDDASSKYELLVINMMTNSLRVNTKFQQCAFRTASEYKFITAHTLNKYMFNSKRAFDAIYIVHCPYGGGTLTNDCVYYNNEKNIELCKYGIGSKQNVIGIAQYGATTGRYFLNKYKVDTVLVKSLIRKFCEQSSDERTYSNFITDFNDIAKTVRDAVINDIREFAKTFQRILTSTADFSFDTDASKKTHLLKFKDRKTIFDELSKNMLFIQNPNNYLLDEDKDLCMFQIFFACFVQSTLLKNIYLDKHYLNNIYLQFYRDIKNLHVQTETDPDHPEYGLKMIEVPAGYILSQITSLFSKYFKQFFNALNGNTESYARAWLSNAITSFNNNASVQVTDEDIGNNDNNYYHDGIIYNLWKIYHRAVVPLFFTYTLNQLNELKTGFEDELNVNEGFTDEYYRFMSEYDRYTGILNDIFIETVICIYNIWSKNNLINELIGVKNTDNIDEWELLFSIIPTSWPHAKVISTGKENDDFMNRLFLT